MEAIAPFIFMWGGGGGLGGHLNFNIMSDILNLRIYIPDEISSYNLI